MFFMIAKRKYSNEVRNGSAQSHDADVNLFFYKTVKKPKTAITNVRHHDQTKSSTLWLMQSIGRLLR